MVASFISIAIGLVIVNILTPGVGINFVAETNSTVTNIEPTTFSFHNFIVHAIPTSINDAMSNNEILQIVIFSIFMGCSISAIDKKMNRLLKF